MAPRWTSSNVRISPAVLSWALTSWPPDHSFIPDCIKNGLSTPSLLCFLSSASAPWLVSSRWGLLTLWHWKPHSVQSPESHMWTHTDLSLSRVSGNLSYPMQSLLITSLSAVERKGKRTTERGINRKRERGREKLLLVFERVVRL